MHWTKCIPRTILSCALGLFSGAVALAAGGQNLPAHQTPQPSHEASAASERNWWKNAVIYEIYPRSFQDSNGDGIGDLNGITQRLDYLKDLGVDAIWLTPCYPSPQVDFGYDISDYKNIDPRYGTLKDFDRLVAEAGKRHIRVIMDMVMNHTSDKHEWFMQSRSSAAADNPYRDWYMWHDPSTGSGQAPGQTSTGKGVPPNNWQSYFGHLAWQWDAGTRQYYYHKFYIQQPDLNWDNPKVHEAFKDIIGFWLKRGVGGFRFDAITNLFEEPKLADEGIVKDKNGNPVINAYGDPQLDDSKTNNQPGVHEVMQEMRAYSDKFGSGKFPGTRVLIGETYMENIAELARMYGPADKPEFHLPMDTQVAFINKLDVTAFRARLTDVEKQIGDNTPLLLFDNHDNPRLDARYGDGVHDTDIQRAIATVLFASRGAALFYYGDEIGMKTTPPTRKEDVKDPIGVTGWPREKGRDGERTPMQWNSSENAGFSKGTPWLPVPPTYKTHNVADEEKDPNSVLEFYKRVLKLRHTNLALVEGNYTPLNESDANVLSYLRLYKDHGVVVALNMSDTPHKVNLELKGKGFASAKSLLATGESGMQGSEGSLEPYGVFIGELTK